MVAAGKRFRGGLNDEPHARHQPGIAPVGRWEGDPQGPDWGGHAWTEWIPLREIVSSATQGGSRIYRIRGTDAGTLLYIGQGKMPNRPRVHVAKVGRADHGQGQILAAQERLECSWTVNDAWLSH